MSDDMSKKLEENIQSAMEEARKQVLARQEEQKQHEIQMKIWKEEEALRIQEKMERDANRIVENIPNLLKYSYGAQVVKIHILNDKEYDNGFDYAWKPEDLKGVAKLVAEKCQKLGLELAPFQGEEVNDYDPDWGNNFYHRYYLGIKVI